jgi:hypothetical protein
MKEEVYNKYPLPQPGNINTQQVTQTATNSAAVAIVGYIIYKLFVAAATFECGGCGVLVTP